MNKGTYTLTEKGAHLVLTMTPDMDETPDDRYPFLSQWDDGHQVTFKGLDYRNYANRTNGDCGPASLASLIWFHTIYRPTVNEVGLACGQPADGNGSYWTNHGQLRAGAASFGLTLATRSPYVPPQLDMDLIRAELADGRPVIALYHYGALSQELRKFPGATENQSSFRGTHWSLVVKMNDDFVYVLDPNYKGSQRSDGDYRPIPIPAFDAAMRRVPESAYCSVPYQGLILRL